MEGISPQMQGALERLKLRSLAASGELPTDRVDRACAELAGALDRVEIPFLILKGPAFAARFYSERWERPYKDCDVLVPPVHARRAEQVLGGLGYRKSPLPALPGDAQAWSRPEDDAVVDLHETLQGVGTDASATWGQLAAHRTWLDVGGARVPVLADVGLGFHAALHAAAHGRRWGRPLEDLDRAIAALPRSVWADARGLAEALRALSAFAAGLRLVPAGIKLAAQLSLPDEPTPEVLIRASGPEGPLALGLESLAQTPGVVEKAKVVWAKLFPRRDFMRAWVRYVGRPDMNLFTAYLWRPVWLCRQLPSSYRKWRVARLAASRGPDARP